MRKWFLILIMAALLTFPSLALAQTDLTLAEVSVQLWPEYDQPSMLVIVDYSIPKETQLPADATFRIPKDANLIAVATYAADGSLLNAVVNDPIVAGDWQIFTMSLDSAQGHFEYYQPIAFNGEQRSFSYLWDNQFAVAAFNISVLEPMDTTALTTTPKLGIASQKDGLKYYSGSPVKLAANEQFALKFEYKKTSDALVSSSQAVQPAAPLDDNTKGKISFSNSLPYVIGGVGLLLIVGGVVYYLQAGKTSVKKSRRRSRKSDNEEGDGDTYCSQCGTRARGGDRFCRVCGSRIKQTEE
ncbi:MAG: zinc ribbon domain-containing protein [Anaerolineales bacterium]|nr:zinc ribbon domain-containing protein [Anaerolineales bacterium]